MAKDDWYRRTTWTERDQKAFFERNARSRGTDSKAQYMRLQAETLLQTHEPALIRSALKLLERTFEDYPTACDRARSFEAAGDCKKLLGDVTGAIYYYQRAIERESEYKGIRTNAGFSLAKLAVEHEQWAVCAEAIKAAEAHGAPIFPLHAYYLYGALAALKKYQGDFEAATEYARRALEAAKVKDTGLSHGRGGLGTVCDTGTTFHAMVVDSQEKP